jgi:hypothetical protein
MAAFVASTPALLPMTLPSSPDATYSEMSSQQRATLIVTTALMPVFAAAGYELLSHIRARQAIRTLEWQRTAPVTVGFVPLQGRSGLAGALSSLTVRF